jgi:flagellar hook-length control protein FliK
MMQNAMDIMAMVQKTNMVKQKFDVPSKALGNEKASFRNELNQARKAVSRDKTSNTKDAETNPQRTTEKKVEKFAKVMSSNNIKSDIKEESVDALEQKTATTDSNVVATDSVQLEKPEENVAAEESIQSMLEMLQQMMQVMEGLKVEGAGNQKLADMNTELKALIQTLEQALAVPLTNQSGEANKLFKNLRNELTELVNQLELVNEYKLDPKQAEQLLNQFTDKLDQAKTELHQILQHMENTKDNAGIAQQLAKMAVKTESKETNKPDHEVLKVQGVDENQQMAATDTNKAADSKDNKNSDENSKGEDDESMYKASTYAETKQTIVGDKLNQEAPLDFVAPQNDKLDLQLNIKQANANLQKESLVKLSKSDIINQVVKKAEIIVQGSHQEMIMKLEPESLGKLNLKLVVENGLITAKFMAESQQVKEVLESSFNQLKDALQEKGISVQSFSVSVGQEGAEFKSSQGFEQWKRTIKLNSKTSGDYIGLDEENSISVNPYSYHDGKVDYRA